MVTADCFSCKGECSEAFTGDYAPVHSKDFLLELCTAVKMSGYQFTHTTYLNSVLLSTPSMDG